MSLVARSVAALAHSYRAYYAMIMPFTQKTRENSPRELAVLLFDGFSNHCLANSVEPARAANTLSGQELYGWSYLTLDGEAAVSSSGLPVMPSARLSEHPGGASLAVLTSYGFLDRATPEALRGLRAAAGRFETVIGMDTGAWLMAASGLLDGRRATIHRDEMRRFAEGFPEVEVVADRYVIEEDRITCGGATAAFDLVLELIRRDHGPMLRLDVANLFLHGEGADLRAPFSLPSASAGVDAAVALMRRNLEVPLPLPELARRLDRPLRTMETMFDSALGLAPGTVYRRLRLAEARRLVEHSRLSVAEIALRCGYADPSAMSRAFRAEYGTSPRGLRQGR